MDSPARLVAEQERRANSGKVENAREVCEEAAAREHQTKWDHNKAMD
jgi:hypothetical protein